ncbi:MAG: hypothetical protein HY094_06840 [Candidatus Melainabacteria bacterium]|nr:hypothetical protein [Candidatus Melainabacteria bacterium]
MKITTVINALKLIRAIPNRPEINTELSKLRKLGMSHKQEQVCRRIFEPLNTAEQKKFTLALSLFLKQGLGKAPFDSFKSIADFAYQITRGLDYADLKRVNDLIDSSPSPQNRFAQQFERHY